MEASFSAMNITIYVAFTLLLTLWTISVICRRYRAYYNSSGDLQVEFGMPHEADLFPINEEPPRGLDISVIETFPKFPYSGTSVNNTKMTDECGVCLGTFVEKELLRSLPKCGHVFHADCVDPWLVSHATCPLCRADLLPGRLPGEMANRADFRINIDQGRG